MKNVRQKNYLLLIVLLIVLVLVWIVAAGSDNSGLRIIFCDVGQGDAVLVTQKSFQLLIDGGPDDKVLNCLGKHVAFWDRTIEIVVLTHPQADHLNGLVDVADRYKIGQFVTGRVGNETDGYQELVNSLSNGKTEIRNVYAGDRIKVDCQNNSEKCLMFEVVWPDRKWVETHTATQLSLPLGKDSVAAKNLGWMTDGTDLNSFSVGLELTYGEFNALFTGDADVQIEDKIIAEGYLNDIEVLKVPHHGSKTGMTEKLLNKTTPEMAIISVGRNNSYGHPREETIKLLRDAEIKFMRTDEDGDVVVESDGVKWTVLNGH